MSALVKASMSPSVFGGIFLFLCVCVYTYRDASICSTPIAAKPRRLCEDVTPPPIRHTPLTTVVMREKRLWEDNISTCIQLAMKLSLALSNQHMDGLVQDCGDSTALE